MTKDGYALVTTYVAGAFIFGAMVDLRQRDGTPAPTVERVAAIAMLSFIWPMVLLANLMFGWPKIFTDKNGDEQ